MLCLSDTDTDILVHCVYLWKIKYTQSCLSGLWPLIWPLLQTITSSLARPMSECPQQTSHISAFHYSHLVLLTVHDSQVSHSETVICRLLCLVRKAGICKMSTYRNCPSFLSVAMIKTLKIINLDEEGFIDLTIPGYSLSFWGSQSRNSNSYSHHMHS